MRAPIRTFFLLLAALALVVAACGDDDDADTGTSADDAPVADGSTADDGSDDDASDGDDGASDDTDDDDTDGGDDASGSDPDAPRGSITGSFVGTALQPGGTPLVDDEVKVYFNNGSNGNLVAIYHGPGLADPTGLCPGNSLNATGQFEHVSNAPAAEGACEGFPTEVGSVRVCTSNVWLYETKIPNNSTGTLYGSLEGRDADGNIVGHYGTAENQPDTPEIDVSVSVYDIEPMFTTDGATEITCADALT